MPNIKGNKSIMLSAQQKEQILKEHFKNELTFSQLSKKYNISYSSVRKWCLDYEVHGPIALQSQTEKSNINKSSIKRLSARSLDLKDREIAMLKTA